MHVYEYSKRARPALVEQTIHAHFAFEPATKKSCLERVNLQLQARHTTGKKDASTQRTRKKGEPRRYCHCAIDGHGGAQTASGWGSSANAHVLCSTHTHISYAILPMIIACRPSVDPAGARMDTLCSRICSIQQQE